MTRHDEIALQAAKKYGAATKKCIYIFVANESGTEGENFSCYEYRKPDLKIVNRSFGYASSLMLFKHITAQILDLHTPDYAAFNDCAAAISSAKKLDFKYSQASEKLSSQFFTRIRSYDVDIPYDPVVSAGALPAMQFAWLKYWMRTSDLPSRASGLELKEEPTRSQICFVVNETIQRVFNRMRHYFAGTPFIQAGELFETTPLEL